MSDIKSLLSPQLPGERPGVQPMAQSIGTHRSHGFGGQSSQGMTPRQILDAVRYWWKLALPTGVLLAVAAAAVVYATFRPMYEATFWIRIEERTPFIVFESKESEQSKAFVQTQIETIRSPMVLDAVVVQREIATIPEIADEDAPAAWLAKQVKVKPVGTSELCIVSFANPSPDAAARVVNAVVDSYFSLQEKEQSEKERKVVEQLLKEQKRRQEEVGSLREVVRAQAIQITGKDPFAAAKDAGPAPAKPLTELENRMVSAEVDEQILDAKLKVFEELAAKQQRVEVAALVIEKAVAENAALQKAATEIAEKKTRLAHVEATVAQGKSAPKYQQLAQAIADQEKALEAFKTDLRKQVKAQLEMTLNGKREEEMASLRSEREGRRITKTLLKERYDRELGSAKGASGDAVALKFKQDELARAEKVNELLSERILRLNTEQGAPARVKRMMEKATAPAAPIQRLPYMQFLIAVLAGLGTPFGLAVLKEQMTRRVTDSGHLEQEAHLSVIGEIAHLPSRSRSARPSSRQGSRRGIRLFEESVDALRTTLLLTNHLQPFRILAITSACKQEGKTSVAVQLAVSIARASKEPVLLVDGDMRSPRLHRIFDVPLEPGLADVLGGNCPLDEAILPTWSEYVHVLPAGILKASPHTLLGNGALGSFLENIPDQYRYVLLDTPPALAASESLVLAKSADAFLLCAMRDVSRMAQVRKATERLIAAGGRLAGTVLSGVPVHQYVQRYGNYPYPEE